VESHQYADLNELKNVTHEPEARLASEALHNWLQTGRYELNGGTPVAGKVHNYVRDPDIVDVVIYPDGKAYAADQQ
jgi:hypothetical protein